MNIGLYLQGLPVSDPRLAIIVVVENPQGRYYVVWWLRLYLQDYAGIVTLMNVPLDKPLDTPTIQ
jgi:cell division protein FtsI (penicillin-binding protein 3)